MHNYLTPTDLLSELSAKKFDLIQQRSTLFLLSEIYFKRSEKILRGRNFAEWAHSSISMRFGKIYFGDSGKLLNLARNGFSE